jgi:Calcium-activated chloride channel
LVFLLFIYIIIHVIFILFFILYYFTGGWANLMDMMSILGILCSAAILCFSDQQLAEYSTIEKIIIFLVAQQVLVFFKYFIQSFLPDDPEWVQELSDRNVFIR